LEPGVLVVLPLRQEALEELPPLRDVLEELPQQIEVILKQTVVGQMKPVMWVAVLQLLVGFGKPEEAQWHPVRVLGQALAAIAAAGGATKVPIADAMAAAAIVVLADPLEAAVPHYY